jgi:transcriptional antiterminator Rof (Rho-off)
MNKQYIPVNTDLVDDLEHYASDHISVEIDYADTTGTQQEMRGKIANVFTRDHQEFLTMEDSRQIRLDQIRSVKPLNLKQAADGVRQNPI